MAALLEIGGAPVVTLQARELPGDGPAFVDAQVLPGRGMMLLQARLRLPSGEIVEAIEAPSPEEAARKLDGGPDDFAGNASFGFGGAILAPYANRIRGRALSDRREIETMVACQPVRLPRNWGGKVPGAEQYAMHGLILDAGVTWRQDDPAHAAGWLDAEDFGGRWPGRFRLGFEWRLTGGGLTLRIRAQNVGDASAPIGIGWHPYLRLPSGDRAQARLFAPAACRVVVNNYDEVLPTGALEPVAGSAYDFTAAAGRALGEQYLDDCFTDLMRVNGEVIAELRDPAAGLGLRIDARAPPVHAFQVYAPPDQAFVALEPQFNLADPFGDEWAKDVDTGMAWIPPGGEAIYEVGVTLVEI